MHNSSPLPLKIQKRTAPMRHAPTGMALSLVEMPKLAVGAVHQDQRFGIGCIFANAIPNLENLAHQTLSVGWLWI
jgi:hypothetical protein